MHLSSPFVSVIMPNYNKGPFAEKAVRSVIEQDYSNFELIFIDDCSTDDSAMRVAERYGGSAHLVLIQQSVKAGAAAARNQGMAIARGDYILFVDSDDWMAPGALQAMVTDAIAHPDCDFIAYPMAFFDHEPGDSSIISNLPKSRSDLLRFLERDQPWLISGPFWKQDFLKQLGGFDEALSSQQDYDLHVRALLAGPQYHYIPNRAWVHYRQLVHSEARRTSLSFEALQARAARMVGYHQEIEKRNLRNQDTDIAIARSLLSLAAMMRWHKTSLGAQSTQVGLKIWLNAYEYQLVSPRDYGKGMGYIRFMHNMLWNRAPALRNWIEERYAAQIPQLLSQSKSTLGKLTFADLDN